MRRAGVTLIELVVALTITLAVFTVGYGAFGLAIDRREAAVAALDRDLRAASVRSSLQSWLTGIRLTAESSRPVFNGADGVYQGLPDDELIFLTSAPTPLGDGLALVRLFVDRDHDSAETGLVAEVGAWLGTARVRVTLVPDAVGLDVHYRSRLLSGRPWHPSWISSTVVPAGLELRIVGAADAPLHPVLAYPIRIPIDGGR